MKRQAVKMVARHTGIQNCYRCGKTIFAGQWILVDPVTRLRVHVGCEKRDPVETTPPAKVDHSKCGMPLGGNSQGGE